MICYLSVNFPTHQDEHYETSSRDARRRASELRKLGFRVVASPLGPQVTSVGVVKMTMLTIYHNGREVPAPEKVVSL